MLGFSYLLFSLPQSLVLSFWCSVAFDRAQISIFRWLCKVHERIIDKFSIIFSRRFASLLNWLEKISCIIRHNIATYDLRLTYTKLIVSLGDVYDSFLTLSIIASHCALFSSSTLLLPRSSTTVCVDRALAKRSYTQAHILFRAVPTENRICEKLCVGDLVFLFPSRFSIFVFTIIFILFFVDAKLQESVSECRNRRDRDK